MDTALTLTEVSLLETVRSTRNGGEDTGKRREYVYAPLAIENDSKAETISISLNKRSVS